MDGRPAGDLRFNGVVLDDTQVWLRGDAAEAALTRAGDLALTVHGADALGCMERLLAITGNYLRTRVQFGVALGSFQALQHRYADMQMDMLEVRALVHAWAHGLDRGNDAVARASLASALARSVARAGPRIGHQAIQMHGGMGVTEELVVSHYNARLQVVAGFLQPWCTVPVATYAEAA